MQNEMHNERPGVEPISVITGYVNSMIETHLSLWEILPEQQQIKSALQLWPP